MAETYEMILTLSSANFADSDEILFIYLLYDKQRSLTIFKKCNNNNKFLSNINRNFIPRAFVPQSTEYIYLRRLWNSAVSSFCGLTAPAVIGHSVKHLKKLFFLF